MISTLAGYAGGTFNFIWMGKPSGILSNDLFMASCITAFVLVNYTPFDIGYKLMNTFPFALVTVVFSQLFRSLGLCKFCYFAYEAFSETPSAYYPTPVFGPILYATLLGNMGGFVLKGLEGHIANGVPWPVQNGVFCASLYHFFVHDADGFIGQFLRKTIPVAKFLDLDDKTFAVCFVGFFMQATGIIQMPQFLGPTFTPFGQALLNPFYDSTTWAVGKTESKYSQAQAAKAKVESKERGMPAAISQNGDTDTNGIAAMKKKRKKKKKTN